MNFNLTEAEFNLAEKIGKRAYDLRKKITGETPRVALDYEMDIAAVHSNYQKLDLQRLLDADDFNFAHDVFGIERHLDRGTGALGDFFVPRFSSWEKEQ